MLALTHSEPKWRPPEERPPPQNSQQTLAHIAAIRPTEATGVATQPQPARRAYSAGNGLSRLALFVLTGLQLPPEQTTARPSVHPRSGHRRHTTAARPRTPPGAAHQPIHSHGDDRDGTAASARHPPEGPVGGSGPARPKQAAGLCNANASIFPARISSPAWRVLPRSGCG